jgi:hypothetical protein
VKLPGQLRGLDGDLWRQGEKLDARIAQRLIKPLLQRARQLQTPKLDELGDLPTRDHADADRAILVGADGFNLCPGKSFGVVYPLHPGMGVENDHLRTPHSSSATLSNGAT